MYDLSRRAFFLKAAAVAAWPSASVAEAASPASEDALRLLVSEVGTLTESFYRTAIERIPFADAAVARYARELAADHGVRLAGLGTSERSAAVLAGGDWRPGMGQVIRASGRAGGFDPFAGDGSFLLAAHILESAAADAFRLGARRGSDLAGVAAEATYHAGLVRTALAATAAGRRASPHAQAATEVFQALRSAPAIGGGPEREALRTLLVTTRRRSRGGFFPRGLKGPIRLSA